MPLCHFATNLVFALFLMVALRPFRALRYNPALIDDLSRVIAPPYDVIDAQEQERLYDASPYNIVRLILGKQFPSDTEADNRYTRASSDFTAWCAAGVLRRDPTPAFYLIEHTFSDGAHSRSRLGFSALLELSSPMESVVYRHEATLEAPKADRTKLLEAVPANLSPIFCVYPDEGAVVHGRLRELADRTKPAVEASLHGEGIRLWVLADDFLIQQVKSTLSSRAVLIADGHHRFEVAYARRNRYGALMSYFVSMAEPALMVRPIHRVIQSESSLDVRALEKVCRLEPAEDLPSLMRWLNESSGQGRFGCSDRRGLYRVTVNAESLSRWLKAPSVAPGIADLDVSLLHGLLFPSLSATANGSGEASATVAPRSGAPLAVRYSADESEAVRAIQAGEGRLAWLLRPIPLSQVYALAAQGLVLPPKSTYFYPKVPSGLAINPLS